MGSKSTIPILLFLFLLFVAVGEYIPFKPVSSASVQTKNTLNQFVMGLFPSKRPRNPYERTEKAIEKEEQGGSANP